MSNSARPFQQRILRVSTAFGFVTFLSSCLILFDTRLEAGDIIQRENQLAGSADWQLTRVKVEAGGCRSIPIEGYCSRQSVKAGETIEIMASSNPARDFRMEFFRTGYYGGRGARLLKTIDRVEGIPQPEPQIGEKDMHECQ